MGATTVTYTYDANGNIATKNDGTYLWTYTLRLPEPLDQSVARYSNCKAGGIRWDGRAIKNIQTNTVVSIWKGFETNYQKSLGTGTVTKYFMANSLRIAEMIGRAVHYHH